MLLLESGIGQEHVRYLDQVFQSLCVFLSQVHLSLLVVYFVRHPREDSGRWKLILFSVNDAVLWAIGSPERAKRTRFACFWCIVIKTFAALSANTFTCGRLAVEQI